MKTTIKLTTTMALTVAPGLSGTGGLFLSVEHRESGIKSVEQLELTPDQVGALIFGLAQACRQAPGSDELLNDKG